MVNMLNNATLSMDEYHEWVISLQRRVNGMQRFDNGDTAILCGDDPSDYEEQPIESDAHKSSVESIAGVMHVSPFRK